MTTERRIFRYFGTIDSERALIANTAPTVKWAIELVFGVEAYKVKLVAKKLTRFHTHRHFIAYFGATEHEAVQAHLGRMATGVNVRMENDINRAIIFDTHRSVNAHLCNNHYTVTLDLEPMKAIPQDNGQAISYDVEAPVNPSITPRRSRREARRSGTPPTSGTPAKAPSTVR